MSIITPDDLASYLRGTAEEDWSTVELLTELANGIIEELPVVFADPAPTRVRAITLEVAARAFRNPEGYSYERGDDYGYGRSADTREAGVYLTESERAQLLGLGTVAGDGFLSVPIVSPIDVVT